jgi:hypothetical protein
MIFTSEQLQRAYIDPVSVIHNFPVPMYYAEGEYEGVMSEDEGSALVFWFDLQVSVWLTQPFTRSGGHWVSSGEPRTFITQRGALADIRNFLSSHSSYYEPSD